MTSITEIRQKFPQYEGLSDGDLLMALHRKFYSGMHPREFLNSIDGAANAHVTIERPDMQEYWREKVQTPMGEETEAETAGRLSGSVGVAADPGPRAMRRARDAFQGITLGAGDEIVAGVSSLLPGREYDTELQRENRRLERGREMEPGQALVTEVLGAVAAPGAAMKLAKGNAATRAAKSSAAAGTAGAVYGFNAGEGGVENRRENAIETGLISAGVGAAAPMIGAKVKQLYDASSLRKAAKALSKSAPSLDELKAHASRIYAQADEVNNLPRAGLTDAAEGMLSDATRKGMDADLMPGAAKVANRIEDAATSPDPNIGFRELDILRRKAQVPAGNVANKPEQAIGSGFIKGIDDYVSTVDPKLSKEIGEAREIWSRLKKNEVVTSAVNKAKNTASGFENGIRIEFRKILNNPKLRRGFSKAEIKALEDVVQGTTASNMAKRVGKLGVGLGQQSNMLLGSLGGAAGAGVGGMVGGPVGGLLGALAIPALGTAAQKVSQRSTRGAADVVEGLVRAGGQPSAKALPEASQGLLEEIIRRGARGYQPVTSGSR